MRRTRIAPASGVAALLLAAVLIAVGCGGRFTQPTEAAKVGKVPTDKSYAMIATWRNMNNVRDIMLTRGVGAQLFILFDDPSASGPPSVPRGSVALYPFTQPVPIGPPFFDPPRGLFNPVAFASAQAKLFVLDEGDSCMAKFDPQRGTCEADTVRNGRRSQIYDYTATWRVREYAITGGDTVSTFTDTSLAVVRGVAADDQGHVYVSGLAVVLDTLSTDPRIRTRKFTSRIYRYARGPRYPGVVPNDVLMPGANWHRDTTWTVLDGSGTSSVLDPRGIRWTPAAGNALLVADRANNNVKLIGTWAQDIGLLKLDGSETPTGTNFNAPEGVAVDGSGDPYVVDRLNRRVLRYDLAGNFVVQLDTEPNADGLPLLDPVAVAVDDSVAYVADLGRAQVIRYKRRP
jgi:hypothetical protein